MIRLKGLETIVQTAKQNLCLNEMPHGFMPWDFCIIFVVAQYSRLYTELFFKGKRKEKYENREKYINRLLTEHIICNI